MSGNPEIKKEVSCVIVEDDEVSLTLIEKLVEKTPVLKLENSFSKSITAADYLRNHKVDLVFLDIEMPDLNGFELIKLLDYRPEIIVITAKEQYAAKSFDYEIHDFLIKPVLDYSRFLKAVYTLPELHVPRKGKTQSVFVKSDSSLQNVVVENISYVEAFGDYVKIHIDKKVLMVLSTLKSFEAKIPTDQFVRVHRSFIVNVRHITNIEPTNLQIGDKIIPISTNFREDLFKKIDVI